jgi:hypothetical protein
MDSRAAATSVWYRVAGLLRRRGLGIDIIPAKICFSPQAVCFEAARLIISMAPSNSRWSIGRGRSGRIDRADDTA